MSQATADLVKIMVDVRDKDRAECGRLLFDLLGHPDSCFITELQLDELLFKVVRKCYSTSIYADMLLMAFGLLQGYEYKNLSIGKRREKFLRESNWLKVNKRSRITDYDSASEEDQKSALESLRNVEKARMKKIADELLDQIKPKNKDGINRYIKSLDNYVEEVNNDAGELIGYAPKEQITFEGTEDDASDEKSISPEGTDVHDAFEEGLPHDEFLDSRPQSKSTQQPPPAPVPKPDIEPSAKEDQKKHRGDIKPSSKFSRLWERLKSNLNVSECCWMACGFLITASLVKMAFFPHAPSIINDYPANDSNTTPVDGITCTQPKIIVYPGIPTPLPIDISPPNAKGAYLYCDSSNSSILCGIDGEEVQVKAWDDCGLNVDTIDVTVTVTPQNRTSSDVYVEIPITVDYTATIPGTDG